MCDTVWQCCCFSSSVISISLYLLLLLLDRHIESIIDSYHNDNIIDYCLSLIHNIDDESYPFNEIHEIIKRDNYHYHYYERNSNKFNYNYLQNSICNKIKYRNKYETDIDVLNEEEFMNDKNESDNNKEIVHETYLCDNNNNNNDECNHCIYYESTSTSFKWTKCEIVSNKEMKDDFNNTNNTNNTPKKLRKESKEKLGNMKNEWNIYTQNLSDFANKMKTWSNDLPQRITGIPSFKLNDNKTMFVYIENETCVENTNCQYLEYCISYNSIYHKWQKCEIIENSVIYNKYNKYTRNNGIILQINWCNLIAFIFICIIIYIVIHYESTIISEKFMWKGRAISLCHKYIGQPICAICYEPFNHFKNELILRCGHKFHETCLNEWEWQQNKQTYITHTFWIIQMVQMVYIYFIHRNHKCPSCNRYYSTSNQKFLYHKKYKDY